MTKGGIIIRLIDVAMIILFGFIAISDIKVRAQIKLPAQDAEQDLQEQKKPELILVKIDLLNGYVVENGEQVIAVTTDLDQLENRLLELSRQHKAAGSEMVVLVEPDEDSMIQHTVNVLDICERHNIAKNINYQSLQF